MFSKKKELLFVFDREQRISLHNFFVFYPINLIFFDSNKIVVEIKKNFMPFNLYKSRKKAKYLLESPFEIKYKLGDSLKKDLYK